MDAVPAHDRELETRGPLNRLPLEVVESSSLEDIQELSRHSPMQCSREDGTDDSLWSLPT